MTVAEVAPVVAAASAVVAAVLTGINLYLTGKRQHVSWTRLALEKSCVDFLTAHYEHWDSCYELEAVSAGEVSHRSEPELREALREADRIMMECVTRFRVLTSPTLVRSARALRDLNTTRWDQLDAGLELGGQDLELRSEAHERARDRFVTASQQVLQIGR